MPSSPNDPLALQLNDLAVANSEGLLNDDEYRLLRQNVFERYSGVQIISVSSSEIPAVPAPPKRKHVELVLQPPPPPVSRPKALLTREGLLHASGVAGFLRRATGRKSAPTPPTSPSPIKLSFIPRLFSKKSGDTPSDTDSSGTRTSSSHSRSMSLKGRSPDPHSPTNPHAHGGPTSASKSAAPQAPPTSPSRSSFGISAQSKYDVIPGGSNDIFDDENLQTAETIRKVIALVEAEGRRLVSAFDDLETSAVIRYSQEHGHRLPSSRIISQHGSTRPPNRSRSNSQRDPLPADPQSVRPNKSLRTSRSVASLFNHAASTAPPPVAFSQSMPPPSSLRSTLSASARRLPSLRHKASSSSISSQGASSILSLSTARPSPAPSPLPGLSRASSTLSRSTSHLPLPLPVPVHGTGSTSTMMELLNQTPLSEGGEELKEVRRRRAEMTGRCEARLEYLRAKLKGAELREKLLKK
ncbi:hypothetical protein C8J57DRAFT_1497938 [Mycena rebaudengoi]|nr:hypothetical protein C8J57DRAFT_1497938 [Mycena rebaudengoi]